MWLMAEADGCLGAAGHEVTDPYLRDLAQQAIRGELTIEEALRLAREHQQHR